MGRFNWIQKNSDSAFRFSSQSADVGETFFRLRRVNINRRFKAHRRETFFRMPEENKKKLFGQFFAAFKI